MKHKILSLFTALCILLSMASIMPVTASAAADGECGENLTWVLDDNGTLTISGTGDMYNWGSFANSPWYDNNYIKNVIIQNGVTSIGEWAFPMCSNLTSIEIPESVTSIRNPVFFGCSSLISISVDTNNLYYTSANGNLFNKDKTTLLQYTLGNSAASYTIPDNVTSIGDYAFYSCQSLTNINIPDSVTSIGELAFFMCNNLTSITIPDSVTFIDNGALHGTAWYNNQPNGLIYVGKVAYKYKGTMPDNSNIILKNDTKSISSYAFKSCSSLTNINLPDSVTSIGDYAFSDCSSLTSINIPDSVTSIGDYAFSDCSSLKDVYYGGSEDEWNSIDNTHRDYYLAYATVHYNYIDIKNTITHTEHVQNSDGIISFDVILPDIGLPEAAKIIVAGFDDWGFFRTVTISSADNTHFLLSSEDVSYVKVFVWGATPLTSPEIIKIQ